MLVVLSVIKLFLVFFFKQKTAYEMRISDWSSDVCSSDLIRYSEGWSQLSTSPDHVTFEAYSKSGVDGLMITPDNARRDVLLLCLHGDRKSTRLNSSH